MVSDGFPFQSELEEIHLEAVQIDPCVIKRIKKPSKAVQLEAVKQGGDAIQWIDDPCLEVQLEAVREDGAVLEFIDDPCLEVQLEAIKQSGRAIVWINNPCDQVLIEAAKDLEVVCYIYVILKRPDIIWKVYTREQLLTCDHKDVRALIWREEVANEF